MESFMNLSGIDKLKKTWVEKLKYWIELIYKLSRYLLQNFIFSIMKQDVRDLFLKVWAYDNLIDYW